MRTSAHTPRTKAIRRILSIMVVSNVMIRQTLIGLRLCADNPSNKVATFWAAPWTPWLTFTLRLNGGCYFRGQQVPGSTTNPPPTTGNTRDGLHDADDTKSPVTKIPPKIHSIVLSFRPLRASFVGEHAVITSAKIKAVPIRGADFAFMF
jgi:hypothetical protein